MKIFINCQEFYRTTLIIILILSCNNSFSQIVENKRATSKNDNTSLVILSNRIDSLENKYKVLDEEIINIDKRLSINIELVTRILAITALIISILGALGYFTFGRRLYIHFKSKFDEVYKTFMKKYKKLEKVNNEIKTTYIENLTRVFDIIGTVLIESNSNENKTFILTLSSLHHALMNSISCEESTSLGALQHLPVLVKRLNIDSNSFIHNLNSLRHYWVIQQQEGSSLEKSKANRIINEVDEIIKRLNTKDDILR